jgi:hypothetical protein
MLQEDKDGVICGAGGAEAIVVAHGAGRPSLRGRA